MNMESKNPLEEIRSAILVSQLYGIENEISELGISDELIKISDAFDVYYGIHRQSQDKSATTTSHSNLPNTLIDIFDKYWETEHRSISRDLLSGMTGRRQNFTKTNNLIASSKLPLASIKEKLSKDSPIYLNLSSTIVAIVVRNVVFSINSYQPPKDYTQYDPISGIDLNFSHLIDEGLKVFNEIKDFGMNKECFDNYQTNRQQILAIDKRISDALLHRRTTSSNKSSNSGCLFFALLLSLSAIYLCGIVIISV